MADKLIKEMGLPKSMANVFAARNITTAQEALALTDFELMLLLDVGMAEVSSALARISEIACPPYQTALALMEQRIQKEGHGGHLPTGLKGLDEALCGGIPFGVLTELVGPAGIGKTQFCMKLSLLASLPTAYGGLNGRVIYIDVESKFSSRRMIEIGVQSFPDIFNMKGMAQEMAGRILVLRPTSLSKFTESLQQIQVALRQQQVKLVVIDSMTAVISGIIFCLGITDKEPQDNTYLVGISLAEFSRIPIVVTNQVRSQTRDEGCQYSFQVRSTEDPVGYDSHLVAALGINWAHSVTIRLVLEAKSGQRFIKLAKSPMSPPLAFPFNITAAGISLLDDYGRELKGAEINKIHSHEKAKEGLPATFLTVRQKPPPTSSYVQRRQTLRPHSGETRHYSDDILWRAHDLRPVPPRSCLHPD
ncbi:DNA repair protein RAD51-2-like protein [Morus notabilis]|uniref:DNA repair protein RAD51-2-like protein n=1 Tax=Morus notabilis TaxID=981085 RepID=W9SAJ1_9ROSA|nr:DNA repair protein RAD51-2-like protein [Morus notabilis]